MARYKVLERSFIGGSLREPGEIVEYATRAGSNLEALDGATVEIPDEWRSLNGLERMALARQLGAPKSRISAAQADVFVQAEIERRAKSAALEPPEPAEPGAPVKET